MGKGLKVALSLSLVVMVGLFPEPGAVQPLLLGDLLAQAWQADQRNQPGKAAAAYRQALLLQPNNPLLHLKYAEMLILLDEVSETARHLAQALILMQNDPLVPADLKRYVCDLLMGRLTSELLQRRVWLGYDYGGWLFPAPFTTLPPDEQQRLVKLVPKEWLFPTKVSEAWFLLSIGEREKGLNLLREAVMAGGVDAAVHAVMSNFVPSTQRRQAALEWLKDAERANNPFLWLAALQLLWRTQQIDAFRSALPKALATMKDRQDLLVVIAEMCEQMRWAEGLKQVRALLPPPSKPATFADLRNELNQAIDEGDLAKTKELVRLVAAEFPDWFRSLVLGAETIRRMLGRQWHELVLQIVQPEVVPELPYETKKVLLHDAAFNSARFSYWMRLFLSRPIGETREYGINLLLSLPGEREPEHSVWLLEQGLLLFPDEPRLVRALARAYEEAGYPHRAYAMLMEQLKQSIQAGRVDYSLTSDLLGIAFRIRQLSDLLTWLRERRTELPLSVFVDVANYLLQQNRPQEALQWLDDALALAKERGWLEDAEIHAKLYPFRYAVRNVPEIVQQWRAQVGRTERLFHPSTYALRMRCLVRVGRVEEAKAVLEEARRLYPDYPFTQEVRELAQLLITDWSAELQRLTKEWRQRAVVNYDLLLRLAYATVKAGKSGEAQRIADELMAAQPFWREGFLKAIALFEQRIAALVPFVQWVLSNYDKRQFMALNSRLWSVHSTLNWLKETSLAGAFMIASVLLLPADDTSAIHEVDHLLQTEASKWWAALTADDRRALVQTLSKERLNIWVLNMMQMQKYMVAPEHRGVFREVEQLQQSQRHSAHALVCQMVQGSQTASWEQIQQWLKMLERADWSEVNWCPLTAAVGHVNLPQRLAQRGFTQEAIQLLQIALRHAPESQKARLTARLIELQGKVAPPKDAEDGKAWLMHAQALWQARRTEEAKAAALKALEAPLSAQEQAEVLYILAQMDPSLALKHIKERLSNFLVAEPNIDPPLHLTQIASALFTIAEQRKDLAAEAAPLLERAVNFSPTMRVNHCQKLALVLFWAEKPLQGVTLLFEPLDKGTAAFREVFNALLRPDIPAEGHKVILQHLDDYLRTRRPSLSLLAEELNWLKVDDLLRALRENAPQEAVQPTIDNLVALANLLRRCVETAEGVVPREFLERVMWQVHRFAVSTKEPTRGRHLPDHVIDAWWQLFEVAVRKAVRSPEDAKSLLQWMNMLWVERPDTAFGQTVWYERLKKLAEGLRQQASP